MKTIYFVTGNYGKVREASKVLKKYNIKLKQIKYSKPEDKKLSTEKIAENAAKILVKKFKKPIIVEDTGIFFEAYKDFPGRNSKVVFNKLGLIGILKKLENKNRRAYFKTAIGYANRKKLRIFVAYCKGKISKKPIGKKDKNLPYDNIFIPDGYSRVFAEIMKTKQKISSRVRAFEKFGKYLSKNA